MKKLLTVLAVSGLLAPGVAMAGQIQNVSGASGGNRSSAGFSHSSVDVQSHININNEVGISSYSSNVTIDLAGVNGRLMHRDKGNAHYSESNGGYADGGLEEGEFDFHADGGGAGFNYDGYEGHRDVEGHGTLAFDHSTTEEGFYNEDSSSSSEESGKDLGLSFGPLSPLASESSESSEESSHVEGSHTEGSATNVDLAFGGEGNTTHENLHVNGGGGYIDANGNGEHGYEKADTNSAASTGWRGQQSETAVDGSISGSYATGWTGVLGTIREYGYTNTNVHVRSFEANNGFEKSASSFNGAQF